MTKEEIIKYITETPNNTNPNVLKDVLNSTENSSSGGNELSNAIILPVELYTRPDKFSSDQRWIPGMTKNEIIEAIQEGKLVFTKLNDQNTLKYGHFYLSEEQLVNTDHTIGYFTELTDDGYMREYLD